MRWTKGQEECVRRGQSLISQPPQRGRIIETLAFIDVEMLHG